MSPRGRSWFIAIGMTLACIGFGVAVSLLAPSFTKSLGAHQGRGIGVTFTFERQACTSGPGQFSRCEWLGTITTEDDSATVTNVVFRDTVPDGVAAGTTVNALWSPRDPNQAFDLDSSSAWINTLANAVVAALMCLITGVTAVIWWRKALMGSQASPATRESQSARGSRAARQSRTPSAEATDGQSDLADHRAG